MQLSLSVHVTWGIRSCRQPGQDPLRCIFPSVVSVLTAPLATLVQSLMLNSHSGLFSFSTKIAYLLPCAYRRCWRLSGKQVLIFCLGSCGANEVASQRALRNHNGKARSHSNDSGTLEWNQDSEAPLDRSRRNQPRATAQSRYEACAPLSAQTPHRSSHKPSCGSSLRLEIVQCFIIGSEH
jgi:hypothetical protein